jgi:hypothetical protein
MTFVNLWITSEGGLSESLPPDTLQKCAK